MFRVLKQPECNCRKDTDVTGFSNPGGGGGHIFTSFLKKNYAAKRI